MRWFKVAAIAGGILIAFLVVGSVIGFVIHAVVDLVIAALVVGAIVVAIRVARSRKQISRKRAEREVREPESYRPLPRADVEPYSTPAAAQPSRGAMPTTHDIDDELARLKREMGG
jgi:predicted lipid-binding transport protein (Tim44 family)